MVAVPVAIMIPYGWLALVVPVVMAAWSILAHHDAGFGTGESMLVIRRRAIQRTTVLVRRSRIQSLRVSQHLLQKISGLASVEVSIASSSFRTVFKVRDIDQTDAWNLIEWVRFRSP